jgi:hypothetical protein
MSTLYAIASLSEKGVCNFIAQPRRFVLRLSSKATIMSHLILAAQFLPADFTWFVWRGSRKLLRLKNSENIFLIHDDSFGIKELPNGKLYFVHESIPNRKFLAPASLVKSLIKNSKPTVNRDFVSVTERAMQIQESFTSRWKALLHRHQWNDLQTLQSELVAVYAGLSKALQESASNESFRSLNDSLSTSVYNAALNALMTPKFPAANPRTASEILGVIQVKEQPRLLNKYENFIIKRALAYVKTSLKPITFKAKKDKLYDCWSYVLFYLRELVYCLQVVFLIAAGRHLEALRFANKMTGLEDELTRKIKYLISVKGRT